MAEQLDPKRTDTVETEQQLKDCRDEITAAIVSFQFIEEAIRVYLRSAYSLSEEKMKRQLTLRLSKIRLERMPLGKLLDELERFNGNDVLVSTMRGLLTKRNEIVHKGFVLMYEKVTDAIDLGQLTIKAGAVNAQAKDCVEKLLIEIEQVDQLCPKKGLFPKKAKP